MLIVLALIVATQSGTGPLDWMVGSWCTESKNGIYSCETWTPIDKGVMRGEGMTQAERVTIRETMRIHFDESGAVFHAEPDERPPADFRAVRIDAQARVAVFENRAHSYPQRIRYWREGESLMAEIATADGSLAKRWTYRRLAR